MQKMRLLVLTIGVVTIFANACESQPPTELPSNSERIGKPAQLAAMLSIHAYARWPDGKFPDEVRVISLKDAVTILKNDPDTLAPSRRRRAVAKLSAYALDNRRVRVAIRKLGGDPEKIAAYIGTLRGRHSVLGSTLSEPEIQSEVADFLVAPSHSAATRDSASGILVALGVFPAVAAASGQNPFIGLPGCCANPPCWKKLYSNIFPQGAVVVSDTSIEVSRPRVDVSRPLDPQKWDECSKFFAPPTPPKGTFFANKDTNGKPIELPETPAGAPYSSRLLFERFACVAPGCGIVFENYLQTQALHLPSAVAFGGLTYYVTYRLDEWHSGPHKIFIDEGNLEVVGLSTDKSRVTSTKRLSFKNPYLDGAMMAVLAHAELAEELAEMACCVPVLNQP